MKIYFRNKAARLKFHNVVSTCKRCPFYEYVFCSFGKSTILDCNGGWWIDGELLDIFKV